MPRALYPWLLLLILFGVALATRTVGLDERPMHTDEAVHGVILGNLLDGDGYRYNPVDYHGPTLYYLSLPLARIAGQRTGADLTEFTLRLLPALCGAALILLLALWRDVFGWPAILWAALFMTLSPIQLYYSRYFIQESLLVLFAFAFLTCAMRWLRNPRVGWASAAGACAGLMHATKGTSALMFAAMLGAAVLLALHVRPTFRPAPRHLLWATLAAVAVSALFYSSFFTHPQGVVDSVVAILNSADRATGQGHEKPWHTHLQWIGWTRAGGFVWSEGLLLALALCGVAFSNVWKNTSFPVPTIGRNAASAAACFLGLYALLLIAIYSAIPYKTPWLMQAPMQVVALLAGVGADACVRLPRRSVARAMIALALFAGTAQLGAQAYRAAFRFAADERMPYAYAHTSPDATRLGKRIVRAANRLDEWERVVQVAGPEYWPLPWYLRSLERVGYWNDTPERLVAPIIVLGMKESAQARPMLEGTHVPQIAGIRPGVLVVAWFRKDLWEVEIR